MFILAEFEISKTIEKGIEFQNIYIPLNACHLTNHISSEHP